METLNHYLSLCLNFISIKVLPSLGLIKICKLKHNLALAPHDTKTILGNSIPKSGFTHMKENSE